MGRGTVRGVSIGRIPEIAKGGSPTFFRLLVFTISLGPPEGPADRHLVLLFVFRLSQLGYVAVLVSLLKLLQSLSVRLALHPLLALDLGHALKLLMALAGGSKRGQHGLHTLVLGQYGAGIENTKTLDLAHIRTGGSYLGAKKLHVLTCLVSLA